MYHISRLSIIFLLYHFCNLCAVKGKLNLFWSTALFLKMKPLYFMSPSISTIGFLKEDCIYLGHRKCMNDNHLHAKHRIRRNEITITAYIFIKSMVDAVVCIYYSIYFYKEYGWRCSLYILSKTWRHWLWIHLKVDHISRRPDFSWTCQTALNLSSTDMKKCNVFQA